MIQLADGRVKVRSFVRSEPGKVVLRSGLLDSWGTSVQGNELTLTHEGKTEVYTRLSQSPSELELKPLPLGNVSAIKPERVTEIQKELGSRVQKDQSIRMDPAQVAKLAGMDAENRQFIRSLVTDVGWIDVDRFGPRASADAFLLVQHSGDLSLMMAALPLIEKDARRYPDYAQPYTLLYDRLQIDLGKKQRYGTQIRADQAGVPMVLPLEDPARVDEFLKELKLPPLSEYLATASKYLYDGKPIRMPHEDE